MAGRTQGAWLYSAGLVVVAARRGSFEREYDLPERVWPREVLDAPALTADDARRELLRIALRACGVATVVDLADHFRVRNDDARRLMPELVEAGDALPVLVNGWKHPAYLDPGARIPRRIEHATLLSPFDPLVWNRTRAARLFGFTYRIEIYTPAPKRIYGYYVLPFLLNDRLVARVDLKGDRKGGVLRAIATHLEPDAPPETAARLAGALREMAAWLGLGAVEAEPRGNGARALRAELKA